MTRQRYFSSASKKAVKLSLGWTLSNSKLLNMTLACENKFDQMPAKGVKLSSVMFLIPSRAWLLRRSTPSLRSISIEFNPVAWLFACQRRRRRSQEEKFAFPFPSRSSNPKRLRIFSLHLSLSLMNWHCTDAWISRVYGLGKGHCIGGEYQGLLLSKRSRE